MNSKFFQLALALTMMLDEIDADEEVLAEERVRVFSLQRGVWTVPTDDVFLRYTLPKDVPPVFRLSACYRIRFEAFSKAFDVHISYKASNSNADPFYFGNTGEHFDSWFDNQEQRGLPPWDIHPEVWRHVCHVFSYNAYTLYWEGQMVFRGPLKGSWPCQMNGTLVFGQEQDSLGGSFDRHQVFRGDLTQVSLWNQELTAAQVRAMAACLDPGRGNVFSTDTADLEVVGAQDSWQDLSTLCQRHQHNVVFPEERNLQESRGLCHRLNASLVVPASDFDNERLRTHLALFEDVCVPTASWKLWLGITDELEDGVWRDFDTSERVGYLHFSPVNAGSSYICASMKADGFWDGDRCTSKRCAACHLERTDFLYLRGLCFDSEFHMRFRVQDYINGRPFFRGYYNLVISWDDESSRWLLVDTVTNGTLMSASIIGRENYPIGKHHWTVVRELCGRPEGREVLLSLAPCADHLFTCNSGDCIEQHLRCDFRYDCEDGSDEVDCSIIEVVDELQRDLPPPGPQESALELVPSLTLTRIAEVDDINMAITLEFWLSLTWIDNRLKLRHLNEKKKDTILSEVDAQKVWQPRYQLVNLDGGQKELLSNNLMVRSANNATTPHFNSVDMDPVYLGAANKISLNQRYIARVTCYFELYAYPFDSQVCSIDIDLPPAYEDYVRLSVEEGSTTYTGPRVLSKYTVTSVKFSESSGGSQMSIELELSRRQGMVVLSNFLPSAMLLVVSWATLFLKLEELNVRAIMSLTTLLVLYTLFSNMSRSLPSTAAIKLIDIWFFFIIFVLFINIMIHVFLGKPQPAPKTNKIASGPHVTVMSGVYQEVSTPIKFLHKYRLVGLPTLVLVFNLYFWIAVLMS
ncbi:uncharacterized protein [Panulirus ornatus]|uniref:uncharacterized protein n=1 Tax=Panulirus ornatus TaxID=150431 RepID=UPI003A89A931